LKVGTCYADPCNEGEPATTACLEDEPNLANGEVYNSVVNGKNVRAHAFVFAPPPYGPQQIGIQFPHYDHWGNEVIKAMIIDTARQPADRVISSGEKLIVTADNLRLLHFIEESGMFRRVGVTRAKA
jgi:hypothetical protein